ncbi:MAG: beta-xylosidase, partial [Terracidiphilus sp.]
MRKSNLLLFATITAYMAVVARAEPAQKAGPRVIVANLQDTTGPVDHSFDLSVGSDYPGTLIRN